jgi:hypothetical protein
MPFREQASQRHKPKKHPTIPAMKLRSAKAGLGAEICDASATKTDIEWF